MLKNLYEYFKYTSELRYIVSSYMREYDMSKANINILYYYKVLDKKTYDYLYSADKLYREVYIGKLLQKNREVSDILKNGFIEFRKRFFISNHIENSDVVSIKNDAIILLNKIPRYTKFDNVVFLNKNTYSSFYHIDTLEFYYFCDKIHKIEKLDIKGINDKKLILHEKYFIDFLKAIFFEIEFDNIENALNMIKSFYNDYRNRKLDLGYYREFNPDSGFKIDMGFKYMRETYSIPEIQKKQFKYVDISYNASLLLNLYKIVIDIYFRNKK